MTLKNNYVSDLLTNLQLEGVYLNQVYSVSN